MSEAAKTHHTEPIIIRLRPDTPRRVLMGLRRFMAKPADEELVEITGTEWYRSGEMAPADYLRELRKAHRMTQAAVAERMNTSAQRVSDWEHGRRGISRKAAKQLAELFGVSPGVFV
jgi:DNA-binding transcriptional regulator YiaG